MARIPIRMPKMSMTMTEGDVGTWYVKVGDDVAEGDVVCDVMTDKVDMEVEATASGTLIEIAVEEGTVPVGEPIAWLEGDDAGPGFGDLLSESEEQPAEEPTAVTAPAPSPQARSLAEPIPDTVVPDRAVVHDEAIPAGKTPSDERPGKPAPVAAVPRARGLAREHGLDLAGVPGTGPDGLVTLRDVEQHLTPMTTPPSSAPAARPATTKAPASAARKRDRSSLIRAAVARKMTESASVPQFTVWRDIDLEEANARRRGISWTTVLLRSYAAALREVPELLCRWQDDAPLASGPPAVALAVATPGGLLVPVFNEPDRADPAELDREVKAVVAAAQSGRLDPSYLGIANGAVSNLGGLGVDRFQALVTPPQASVLALGSIRPRPVAVPGGVGLALSLTAGLTVDHRVADGAQAAALLDAFAWNMTADAD